MATDGIAVPQSLGLDVYEAINPIDLPRIERGTVAGGGGDGIYIEGADAEREFFRYGAAFVDDPDGVGLFGGDVGPALYLYPPAYTAAVSNVALVGYRTILAPNKQFFTDEGYADAEVLEQQLQRISRPDPFSNEQTGLRPTRRERYFQFDPGGRANRHIEGNVVVLCSDEPLSYGSFLFRVVPKVKAVRDLELTEATCIAYADQKPFMDLLNLCGIPKSSIRLHDFSMVTQIDRAIIPSLRDPHAYLDPETFDLYAELRESYGMRPTGRKLYVSRVGIG